MALFDRETVKEPVAAGILQILLAAAIGRLAGLTVDAADNRLAVRRTRPVVAVHANSRRPIRERACQNAVRIRNGLAFLVQCGFFCDSVGGEEIRNASRNQNALRVEPGTGTNAISGVNRRLVLE